MNDTVVGVYTIGQTPRPDLTEHLADRFGPVRFEVLGALDDLPPERIPACGSDGYPLETRLHDGTRVVVDSAFLEPRLQQAIAEWDGRVAVHLILCAGSFPGLTARRTLIRPFRVAVAELAGRGLRSLEVVVPFAAQATPSAHKWEAAGFSCRMHALGEKSANLSAVRWLSDRMAATRADAVLFDYVGFPVEMFHEVAGEVDIPVFDLGHVALDALARTLQTL
jgi:protein AroM